ncbi:MAG: AMMECR1 domain-containing protein, partial [Planctomycetota bacterium]
ELGRHGIYITKGSSAGCFLPQVATETGWTKEEFLSQCCSMKASLSLDAWKKKDIEVYIFTAEIISEKINKNC